MKTISIISTKDMTHEEWLQARKSGIGGSDAGAICGLNPYTSPLAVYQDKVSQAVEEKDNEAMRQGRDLEDYVARRFMEETGKKVRRANVIYKSTENPFMFANVDRLIVGEDAGLEWHLLILLTNGKMVISRNPTRFNATIIWRLREPRHGILRL